MVADSLRVISILICFVQNFEPFLKDNARKPHLLAYESYVVLKLLFLYSAFSLFCYSTIPYSVF